MALIVIPRATNKVVSFFKLFVELHFSFLLLTYISFLHGLVANHELFCCIAIFLLLVRNELFPVRVPTYSGALEQHAMTIFLKMRIGFAERFSA